MATFEQGQAVIVTGPGNFFPKDLFYERPLTDDDLQYVVRTSYEMVEGKEVVTHEWAIRPEYANFANWHRLKIDSAPGQLSPQYYDAPEEFVVDASEFGVQETRLRALKAIREQL